MKLNITSIFSVTEKRLLSNSLTSKLKSNILRMMSTMIGFSLILHRAWNKNLCFSCAVSSFFAFAVWGHKRIKITTFEKFDVFMIFSFFICWSILVLQVFGNKCSRRRTLVHWQSKNWNVGVIELEKMIQPTLIVDPENQHSISHLCCRSVFSFNLSVCHYCQSSGELQHSGYSNVSD